MGKIVSLNFFLSHKPKNTGPQCRSKESISVSIGRQKQDTKPLFLRIQISLELRTYVCQRKSLSQKAHDKVEKVKLLSRVRCLRPHGL